MDNPFESAIKKAELDERRIIEKTLADAKRKREHTITIYVRGCDTTRDCYCLNTNGFSHNEGESPWVVDMEGNYEKRGGRDQGKEQPLEYPFLPGEDLEEYRIRMAKADAWHEGMVAHAKEAWDAENPYI